MKPISGAIPVVGRVLTAVKRGARAPQFRAEMEHAQALWERGALRRVLEITATYVGAGRDRAWALRLHARALKDCARYAEAEPLWERLLEHEPDNGEARQGLRRAARLRGVFPPGGTAFQQLGAKAAKAGRWVTLKDLDEAIAAGSPDADKLASQRTRMLRNQYGVHNDVAVPPEEERRAPVEAQPTGAAEAEAPIAAGLTALRLAQDHFRAGRYAEALATLPADALNQTCGDVRALRRDALIRNGAYRAGLAEAFAAFRVAPTPENFAPLARLLVDDGRMKALTVLWRRGLPRGAMNYAPWRLAASETCAAMGRFDQALSLAESGLALDPTTPMAHKLVARAEWLCGHARPAWRRYVAIAMDRPELVEGEAAFQSAADEIRAAAASAEAAGDEDLTEALLALRTQIAEPYLLKLERPLSEAEGRALASLAAAPPDADGVMALTESYSEPVKCGLALRALADAAERAGNIGAARRALEAAVWKHKVEGGHVMRLRRFMADHAPRLTLTGSGPRVLALMVTCKPNLEKAGRLASAFTARTGLPVATLSADDAIPMPVLEPRPYGHHLTVPGDDLYLGLAQKMNAAYRYLAWCSNADAVLKIDDDVVVQSPNKLAILLEELWATGADYAGKVSVFQNGAFHIGRHPDQHRARSSHHAPRGYANGAMGYWMSRRALEAVARLGLSYYADWVEEALYEDVYIGEVLAEAGIRVTHVEMLSRGGLVADVFEASSAAKRLSDGG